jgi:hypothetical protein
MNLRPGSKLHSAVYETQVVVVRAPCRIKDAKPLPASD